MIAQLFGAALGLVIFILLAVLVKKYRLKEANTSKYSIHSVKGLPDLDSPILITFASGLQIYGNMEHWYYHATGLPVSAKHNAPIAELLDEYHRNNGDK